jgi:hypothetical protein
MVPDSQHPFSSSVGAAPFLCVSERCRSYGAHNIRREGVSINIRLLTEPRNIATLPRH